MTQTSILIIVIALLGAPLSWFAHVCGGFVGEEGKIFGKIHWWHIGVAGYVAIAISAWTLPIITMILVSIAGMVTVWLAWKWFQLKSGCPVCIFVWILNAALIIVATVALFQGDQSQVPQEPNQNVQSETLTG